MMSELSLDGWNKITPQLLSILLTTLVICTFCIVYNTKIRNHKSGQKLSGFLVITEMFVTSVENLIVGIMGNKYKKLTPYGMYIIMYIFISSIISLIGIEPLTSSFTVTLSMGCVTFMGIYYFGIKYQKISFFKKFLNPLELIMQFVPLISISFRLFGNILGGTIMLGLLYGLLIGIQGKFAPIDSNFPSYSIWNIVKEGSEVKDTWSAQYAYWWTGFNIFTTIIMPWLHLYFDLFDGGIQSVVFLMLTFSYWHEAMGEEHEPKKEKVKKIKDKKNKTISYENDIRAVKTA